MLRTTTVLLALALLGPAAGRAGEVRDEALVARVADRSIVAAEVREAVVERRRQDLGAGRLDSLGPEAYRAALERRVDVSRLSLEARRRGLDRRADVARALEKRADELLAQVLLEEIVATAATDAALEAFFRAHPAEFSSGGRVRARHLVVATRADAEALRAQLASGADFAALARARNTDSTRASGGELGWVERGVMVQAFDEALFELGAGERSAIVQTSFGFHVIEALELEPPTLAEFSTVKERVRQRFAAERVSELERELAAEFPARVHERVLQALIGEEG